MDGKQYERFNRIIRTLREQERLLGNLVKELSHPFDEKVEALQDLLFQLIQKNANYIEDDVYRLFIGKKGKK